MSDLLHDAALLQVSIWIYTIVALSGASLLLYVLYLAMDDLHLNRTDNPKVIKDRKRAFLSDAIFIGLTVGLSGYWIISPIVALVGCGFIIGGAYILWVNVISLRDRAPHDPTQTGSPVPAFRFGRRRGIL